MEQRWEVCCLRKALVLPCPVATDLFPNIDQNACRFFQRQDQRWAPTISGHHRKKDNERVKQVWTYLFRTTWFTRCPGQNVWISCPELTGNSQSLGTGRAWNFIQKNCSIFPNCSLYKEMLQFIHRAQDIFSFHELAADLSHQKRNGFQLDASHWRPDTAYNEDALLPTPK